MTQNTEPLSGLYNTLAAADQTYRKLPLRMRLEIEKISQGLSEFGPRKLGRSGMGTEFFEAREFRPDADDPRKINARLSARAGRQIIIEKEAEIRQHFFLWRDATASMDYSSGRADYTKKQAAEIMLLAFAKHLARNEEMIGILDQKGLYRGGKAAGHLAAQLFNDVAIIAGADLPRLERRLPRHSTTILFSDFLSQPEEIDKTLAQMTRHDLKGFLVMVLDPQEITFDYKGHIKFRGIEGEGEMTLKKAEKKRDAYLEKLRTHIEKIENICRAKGFSLIIQRTDEPLQNALLSIYGLGQKNTATKEKILGL